MNSDNVSSENDDSSRFRRIVLDNGLTILFEKRDVDVTSVMLGVKYGSGYDSIKEKGLAHFIEHMCFKGTSKRIAKEISGDIEKVGGELNAFTHEEATVYYAKLPSGKAEIAMDVIFDIFFNPEFPEDEIKKEASVICEEIKMYNDNPTRHGFDVIKENLYEEPFGYSGTGRVETVLSMTREDLKKRHDMVYVPKNSVLCVVGNNDFDNIVALAEKFSPNVSGDKTLSMNVPKIVKRNHRTVEEREGIEQVQVFLGFHFPFVDERSRYSADVFSAILGQGMSSKLFEEVREKRGLAYSVKSVLDVGRDYGYMVIWAGTNPENINKVKRVCLEEFAKMGSISEAELEAAKIQVVGNWKVDSEDSGGTSVDLFMEEIRGNVFDYYKYEKKINSVKLEDIERLAEIVEYSSFSLEPK